MQSKIKPILKLIRPHQYIKNIFVFTGVIFSHQWANHYLISSFLVFIAFCLISSSVYIFNDIIDIEHDKKHPKKFNRPLASNQISVSSATIMMTILMALSLLISYTVSHFALLLIFLYFILNLFYSVLLKNIVILDVFIISMGFMCRILIGTIGLNIVPSHWLLLCGFTITLFLGFSKRFSELKILHTSEQKIGATRSVLIDYDITSLERFMTISAACTIMSYASYTVSAQTLSIHNNTHLVYTLPIVVYGIFRYLYLIYTQEKGSDTSKDILTDKHMFITAITWFLTVIWLLA